MSKFAPNILNETGWIKYTHRFDFSYLDIPAGIANNTSKVFGAGYLPVTKISDEVIEIFTYLTTPFQNTLDSGFSSTTLDVGDANSATRFASGIQINANGSFVTATHGSDKNYIYTAAVQLQINLNSMNMKSLSSLNAGRLYIEWNIFRPSGVAITQATPFGTGYV